jgi:hypothetical protein
MRASLMLSAVAIPIRRYNKLKTLEQINAYELYGDDQFYNHSQFSDSIFSLTDKRG